MTTCRNILITGLILAGLIVSVSAETVPKPVTVYLGIGPTAPIDPALFRDDHKTGFHVFTSVGYSLNPNAEVIGRLEMHLVAVDFEERFGDNVSFDGGGIDMLLFGVDIKLNTHRYGVPIRPFVLTGAGWSRLSQSAITTSLAFEQYAPLLIENQTRFYFNIGIGTEIRPSPTLNMFLLARYLEIRQDSDHISLVPITFGIRF
ncbi:MAG: outer membrane beta-barrel protein [Candidatus Zixiibacteriota bacterium]|nr:MAG: outer membrane beta-barrel protein [candidate division Zixibacteria bacterium]